MTFSGQAFLGRFFSGWAFRLLVAAWALPAKGAIAHAQQPAAAVQKIAGPTPTADELVRQALRSRTLGNGDPTALLARALAVDPRSEPAHWHSGFVRESGSWIKYDAVDDIDTYRRLLDRYETERRTHPNSIDGHWAMARWCADHGLPMQERAHLFKVLELNSDHEPARVRLGYVREGQQWAERTEIENTRRRKFEAEQAFKKWSTALKPIRIAFESGDPARIATAKEKLAAIRDPDAIPAMEATLSQVNLEAASAVVLTIRQMTGPDAAIGLARQAVFADWYPVGKQAAEALRDYDELSYVPLLLSALSTPTGNAVKVTARADNKTGTVIVRYQFERELHDRIEKVTYEIRYRILTYSVAAGGLTSLGNVHPLELLGAPLVVTPAGFVPPGTSGITAGFSGTGPYYKDVVNARLEADRAQVEGLIEDESRSTKRLNERICRALIATMAEAAPTEKTDDPKTWWDWWTKRREVLAGQKTVSYSNFVSEAVEVVPRYTRPLFLPELPGFNIGGSSCLAAGTKVWTDVGPRPVERIQLGDRVLSQNVETGELSYRAVLRPTNRPAAPTVILKFGNRQIRATGGHPFWAAGRGWLKAREFEPGMRMVSVAGTAEVTGIEPAADLPAYNLVVDEFHTYFVGDDLVLSHDNLPPQPTRGGIPGEAAR